MNTLQKGSVRYIVFRERNCWYAAGLEFNIVESGDTPLEALNFLFEALQGYVEAARKYKARPVILNQKTDVVYENMWRGQKENKKSVLAKVFTSGVLNLNKIKSFVPTAA